MDRSKDRWFRTGVLFVVIVGLAGIGGALLAQAPAPPQAQSQALAPQELDNLVAPIALYPDPLLGQVLVASTYPLELVEAQQWLQANGNLRGQDLTNAARQQDWDASVQAMVAMPDVLAKLNQDVRWTTDLGNAFLAQQADVMSAVQRMRARARANGKLESNAEETVNTEQQNGQAAIQIVPADPQVIYVPTYDPQYIWGPPVWGYYPPLYYPAGGFWFGPGIDIGFCFGGWGGWGWGGWGWGWGPNWFGGSVFVNNYFFNHYGYRGYHGGGYGYGGGYHGRTAWGHDPNHRLGVNYPNSRLAGRFGAASQASRMAAGRSGNFHGFNPGTAAGRNSFSGTRGAAPQGGATRGFQSPRSSTGGGGWQRFGGQGQNNRGSSAWGTGGSQPRTQAQGFQGQQRSYGSQSPQRGYSSQSPQRGYGTQSAPRSYSSQSAQRGYGYQSAPRSFSSQSPQRGYGYQSAPRSYGYSAPQRSYSAAPRMSAPSYGGGGGSRSFGGGGGYRSSAGSGGGSFHSSGGGGGGFRSGGGGGGGFHGGGGGHGRR